MATNNHNTKLAQKAYDMIAAEYAAGSRGTASTELRRRIVGAAERYADLAESVARNLAEAAKRIRTTESFTEPRSATGWCGGLEDLMRLRGEIDGLTTALEMAEYFDAKRTDA